MEWKDMIPILTGVIGAFLGYAFGTFRDRSSTIRKKKIEAISRLHEFVLEIKKRELSDGETRTLHIRVEGGTSQQTDSKNQVQLHYFSELTEWRSQLEIEEDRARLWIDRRTVDIVSKYFLLMMHCYNWERFGKGKLTEDKDFLRFLDVIFGKTKKILRKVIIIHSKTSEPWLLNCVLLSDMCLEVIQHRLSLEISSPFFFRVKSLFMK